jgi:ComF family protein
MQRSLDAFKILGKRLVNLVYPPSCIACSAALAEADGLGPACWRQIPFITHPFCQRYGTPLPVDHGGMMLSPLAIADPPVFTRARAVARYDGLARELVHGLKYGDRMELAHAMGQWMAREGAEILSESTLLVPIPLHHFRLWRRRFNQAASLADAISRQSGIEIGYETLRRVKATKPQVGLTRTERAANLEKAFKVNEADVTRIAGARIVLVDDVMTTASTGNAAARALLRAGAASVDLLVFALVAKVG